MYIVNFVHCKYFTTFAPAFSFGKPVRFWHRPAAVICNIVYPEIRTCQAVDQHQSAAWSFPALLVIQLLVIHLISACQPLEKYLSASWTAPNQPHDHHLLSRMIIASAAWSVSTQSRNQCLLSPVRCAWQTLESTVSHFISDYQSLDQHLSTTLSAPVSRLIRACQLLDHWPFSRLISTNAATR